MTTPTSPKELAARLREAIGVLDEDFHRLAVAANIELAATYLDTLDTKIDLLKSNIEERAMGGNRSQLISIWDEVEQLRNGRPA